MGGGGNVGTIGVPVAVSTGVAVSEVGNGRGVSLGVWVMVGAPVAVRVGLEVRVAVAMVGVRVGVIVGVAVATVGVALGIINGVRVGVGLERVGIGVRVGVFVRVDVAVMGKGVFVLVCTGVGVGVISQHGNEVSTPCQPVGVPIPKIVMRSKTALPPGSDAGFDVSLPMYPLNLTLPPVAAPSQLKNVFAVG